MQTNRGGQITYHGPGQVVAYPLVDLQRLGIYVKEYVYRLEHCVLAHARRALGLTGPPRAGRAGHLRAAGRPLRPRPARGPATRERLGVAAADPFAGLGKIAALGVKVSRHRTYHGLALNVAMDLRPFAGINPCGYAGLPTVDLATLGINVSWDAVAQRLAGLLASHLSP